MLAVVGHWAMLWNYDVCSICMGGEYGGEGGASKEECCRELLEEGGYL